jgi:hypothetical protein
MNLTDYRSYYLNLILGTLGGNHAHFKITDESGEAVAKSAAYRRGLTVLALVSLIEANFLSKQQLRELRGFQTPQGLPASVNLTHLSCYIYLRDCFAHNPNAAILPPGANTTGFVNAVNSGTFTYATVQGTQIDVTDTHELHLIVLRLFGENV